MMDEIKAGDRVAKTGGDYSFEGEVLAGILKRSGALRYVVEDDRGLLFIFRREQLVVLASAGMARQDGPASSGQ